MNLYHDDFEVPPQHPLDALKVGDWVVRLNKLDAVHGGVTVQLNPDGTPWRVVSLDLPCAVLETADGRRFSADLRNYKLKLLRPGFVADLLAKAGVPPGRLKA